MNDRKKTFALTIILGLGMLAFGFAPILVKLKPATSSPYNLAAIRTLIAVVVLLPFWLIKGNLKRLFVNKALLKYSALAGLFLGLHFIFWITSLSYTSVASASVLVTIHPIFIIIVEAIFFKRRYPKAAWFGVLMAFSGVVLLSVQDMKANDFYPQAILGDVLAGIAALLFVGYFFIGDKLRARTNVGWLEYVFPLYLFSAISCFLVLPFLDIDKGIFQESATLWYVAIALAVGPQLLGHGSINYAVKYISPTLLSTLILFEPIISSVLALFIFGEKPHTMAVSAMSLTIFGIVITWLNRKSKTDIEGEIEIIPSE